jgi:hypothetical protein
MDIAIVRGCVVHASARFRLRQPSLTAGDRVTHLDTIRNFWTRVGPPPRRPSA